MTCVEASDWLSICMATVPVKNMSFHDQKYFPPPPEMSCNSPETELYLHLTEKGLAVITNFPGTRFDTSFMKEIDKFFPSQNNFCLIFQMGVSFATDDFCEAH